ncbi:hypothetical protein H0H81_008179 [Sphagnurus paluster]|uniref:Complex 1 LYR protein domain-containing protein n=1 Tax=Sphagnurus paluster TaxID=117069 RepID=A0A9P7K4Z5_9AGAR|nr:hypothetical protein H0H81_008179 [Sphagnurus paluster]
MQQHHQPSQESLAFRANVARLISPLRRVRPRVPFYQLAAHRIPTLWSLYRGLLKEAPTDDIKWRMKSLFRKNHHLTSPEATKGSLMKGYKFLDAFKLANAGDEKQRAILSRYSHMIATRSDKQYMAYLMRSELAWQRKLANRPIMTGGLLRPSFANRPLPRLKPQPWAITSMIFKRRRARERRMVKLAGMQEDINDLRLEAELEEAAARHAGLQGKVEPVFAGYMNDWGAPIYTLSEDIHKPCYSVKPLKKLEQDIRQTFKRDHQRAKEPYSKEMLDAIKAAKREKVTNKTRERERERRGEVLRRTILRMRKGPPAHVLAKMSPEQRQMDRTSRSVSEVGYVAQVKMKLGFKLRNPDAWKMEGGAPENKATLDQISKEIWEECQKREKREKELLLEQGP